MARVLPAQEVISTTCKCASSGLPVCSSSEQQRAGTAQRLGGKASLLGSPLGSPSLS